MEKITQWSVEEKKYHANTARNVWAEKCWGKTERLHAGNCQHCELRKKNPNYSGWARIYVEAGIPVNKAQIPAFIDEINSDNEAYALALLRSVITYGLEIAG